MGLGSSVAFRSLPKFAMISSGVPFSAKFRARDFTIGPGHENSKVQNPLLAPLL